MKFSTSSPTVCTPRDKETRVDVGTRFAVSLAGGYRGTSPLRTDLAVGNALTGEVFYRPLTPDDMSFSNFPGS